MNDDIRMPFGKYTGQRLADIPVDYLDWLIGQSGIREPLVRQIVDHLKTSRIQEWSALEES